MKSHEVDFQIYGDDLQFVEIELDPNETVIAEAGMMMYMEDGIGFETKMGDGSKPDSGLMSKIVSVGKRALTGESLFMTHFSNQAPAGKRHAIVIFTDGDDSECGGPNVCRAKRDRVVEQSNASNVDLFTIGLSADVNFEALGELARGGNGVFLFAASAEQLIPLYGSLGALLSRSLLTYKVRWTVQSATPGTFASGRSVLGKVQVDAGVGQFEVPFIVGIE